MTIITCLKFKTIHKSLYLLYSCKIQGVYVKFILLCMISLISVNSFGAFQQIWTAYKKSKTKEIRDLSKSTVVETFNYDKKFNDFSLDLSAAYQDDALKNLNAFSPRETIVSTYSAKLSKATKYFGTFAVEHSHIDYDLSNWQPALRANFNGDLQYDVRTKVSYSYDFFKKDIAIQSNLVKSNFDEQLSSQNLEQEQEFLDVFTRFIQAKLSLYQIRLTRKSVKKDLKRIKLLSKRVKSGSSRKVDLYLAQSAYHTQSESIENSKKNLEENLSILEFILGVKIDDSLLQYVKWDKVPITFEAARRKNPTLDLLEKRLEVSRRSLEQIKNTSKIGLALNLEYETNGVRNSRSKAYSDNFEGDHNRSASLIMTIPLGLEKNSALKNRLTLDKKLREMQLENKKGEIQTSINAIKKQIYFTQNALDNSKKRSFLLKKALEETNKLYSRGQSNFDEVLRREENYISAILQEKSNLAGLELLIANLAFLEGNIEAYLDSYRD